MLLEITSCGACGAPVPVSSYTVTEKGVFCFSCRNGDPQVAPFAASLDARIETLRFELDALERLRQQMATDLAALRPQV